MSEYIVKAVFAGVSVDEIAYTTEAEGLVDALRRFMKIINVNEALITITEIYEK